MSKRADGRVERPILFSTEMVRAILDGRKTETRRAVKWPSWASERSREKLALQRPATGLTLYKDGRPDARMTCPYGQPGDLLWVRETWAQVGDCGVCPPPRDNLAYRADYPRCVSGLIDRPIPSVGEVRWTPSIHMPRWASRIVLRVEEVRVERVQSIDEAGAEAEGVTILAPEHQSARGEFVLLWDAVYGNWQANPWVWVVQFGVVEVKP